jgi:hypothetical protein
LNGSIPISPDLEADTTAWIEVVTGYEKGAQTYHEWLQDGIVLCELVNHIKPGSIAIINPPDASMFKKMENVMRFVQACRDLGVLEKDLCNPPDLCEAKNLSAASKCIMNLGAAARSVEGFKGPYLGVKQVSMRESISGSTGTGTRRASSARHF